MNLNIAVMSAALSIAKAQYPIVSFGAVGVYAFID